MIRFADQFVARDRQRLQPVEVLDATTGKAIRRFTVAPDNSAIGGLPTNCWYWGSIRPSLFDGDKLFMQSMWRNILVDLSRNHVYQPNADQRRTGHFVRGDEQVPTTIGGGRAYGGIGTAVVSLDLRNGTREVLMGQTGVERNDATPLTPPLSRDHYMTFPGDGYTDRIGAFIVANGRGYYVQYGWIYCFDGTVRTIEANGQ